MVDFKANTETFFGYFSKASGIDVKYSKFGFQIYFDFYDNKADIAAIG